VQYHQVVHGRGNEEEEEGCSTSTVSMGHGLA
jgi:hypothetical protein